jgi:hypothetical protein
MFHGSMDSTIGIRTAGLLAKDPLYRDSIINFEVICKDCYSWGERPRWAHREITAPGTIERDKELINGIYNQYFRSCAYPIVPTARINDERIKRYCNYIILMKNEP